MKLMSTTPGRALAGLVLLLQTLPSSAQEGAGGPGDGALAFARTEGASLSYSPLSLPGGTARLATARETLVQFSAVIRTEVGLGYRRKTLPPGEYRLAVEARKEGGLDLVFLAKESASTEPAAVAPAGTAAAAGAAAADVPAPAGAPGEKRQSAEKAPSPALLRVPLKEKDGDEFRMTLDVALERDIKAQRLLLYLRLGTQEWSASLRAIAADAAPIPAADDDPPGEVAAPRA